MSHALSSVEELIANDITFSHATNDCNVFHWQAQSALNGGRLSLTKMQADKVPFLIIVVKKGEPIVLICPEQADTIVGKNVIIGEPREAPKVEKVFGCKVVLEKDDGKNQLKITKGSAKHLSKQQPDEATVEAGQAGCGPVHIAKLAMLGKQS